MESCAQENKTCFVQICIWYKYQPFRISGSAEHSAALAVYQSQHLAPWTAGKPRSCAPTLLQEEQQMQCKHRARKSQQLNWKIISKHPCFAMEIKLAKPLEGNNLPDRILKQSWDL